MRFCSSVTTGREAGKTRDVSTEERVSRTEDRSNEANTFQPVDLGRLIVNGELSFSESPEAAGIGLENLLEDLAAFFNDDLSRRARRASEADTKEIRIDCKQSARISGTTPSGRAVAHPLEAKSPDRRKAIRK